MSVTLLFTDIEGSTRLVQELGDGYAGALEQHRVAVRAALAAHGGEEIDCRGDEFSLAFVDPAQAIAAAEETGGRLGQQHLPAVACRADARGAVHVEPDVAAVDADRLARVDADPDADRLTLPAVGGQRLLPLRRRRDRVAGRCEGVVEAVTLHLHLDAAVARKRVAQ